MVFQISPFHTPYVLTRVRLSSICTFIKVEIRIIIILNESRTHKGHYPLFKNGVLFTNRLSKGEVFPVFLRKIGWRLNKILFMDDTLDQLKSVESAANALNIEFIGFHYIAAEATPCDFDQKLGEFQFRNLVENGQWMTDAEAKKVVKQQVCN